MLTFLKSETVTALLKSQRAIAVLKSEKAIDGLRWSAAFVAVLLAYGVAAWMLLRPTGWQLGVNGPVVEVNLSDLPQPAAVPPSDRASEPASPAPSANAARDLGGSADDQQNRTAERAASDAAGRTDAPAAARDADAADAAEKTAALEQADKITQPASPAGATPETPPKREAPPKTEAPAADSGGGGRPTAAPPRIVTPDASAAPSVARTPIDTSTSASTARAPIDTNITVNQGRSPLRSARGGPVFRGATTPQLRLAVPLATAKDSGGPFSKKPGPIAGSTLPLPGSSASAANRGHAQDAAQKPAINVGGGLARNAIGSVIEQHAVVPHAGAPLGLHPLPGAMSAATASEHIPATAAAGAPLPASSARPANAGLSTGAANPQAGHPDQALHASQLASMGGPAINGAGLSRPASSVGAVGGPPKAVAGALNGSSFRPKYR